MGRDDREYRKRTRKYDQDSYDTDDYREAPKHNPGVFERVMTPGTTTNNIIKTAATGVIAGGSVLLMLIYWELAKALLDQPSCRWPQLFLAP